MGLHWHQQPALTDCLATVLAVATAMGPVVAQPSTDTNDTTDESDQAPGELWQPVSVITRKDIETSGVTTLDELLSDRAYYNSFGLHRPRWSQGYQVLVDGRYPAGPLNLLPLSAVERIEVLSNGTAAMDDGVAVAGAINILLRRDYEGFEVAALGGLPQASSGATGQASILWGGGVGRGHLVVGVDSVHKGEIPGADRDSTAAPSGPQAAALRTRPACLSAAIPSSLPVTKAAQLHGHWVRAPQAWAIREFYQIPQALLAKGAASLLGTSGGTRSSSRASVFSPILTTHWVMPHRFILMGGWRGQTPRFATPRRWVDLPLTIQLQNCWRQRDWIRMIVGN